MLREWDDRDGDGRWLSGNIGHEDKEYIYEVLLTPFPTKFGIYSGRIAQLYLYDEEDQTVAEYNQKWIIGPEKGTDAYKIVGKLLKEHNFRKKGQKTA